MVDESVSETGSQPTDSGAVAEEKRFTVPGIEVVDRGRITIPARFRDRFDIEEGDLLDVYVEADSASFWSLHHDVDGSGRIRLPVRERRLYNVEDGDVVDIQVTVTGLSVEDFE